MPKSLAGSPPKNSISKEELLNLVVKLEKIWLVAEALDTTPSIVRYWIVKHSIISPKGFYTHENKERLHKARISQIVHTERKEKIITLISNGNNLWRTAEEMNVAAGTIRQWLKNYEIKAPKGFMSMGKPLGRKAGFVQPPEIVAAMRERATGERNPFFGKKHSEKTRVKMSQNHARLSGDENPFKKSLKDPVKLAEHKDRCKQLWDHRDDEWMREYKEKCSQRMANTAFENSSGRNHVSGRYYSDKADEFWFRSSWERDMAIILDDSSLVISYKVEGIAIPYKDFETDEWRHFKPDFVVNFATNCRQAMIEIKPKALQKHFFPRLIAQYEYCLLNGLQFVILGEKELYGGNINQIIEDLSKDAYYDQTHIRCGLVAP